MFAPYADVFSTSVEDVAKFGLQGTVEMVGLFVVNHVLLELC